VGTQLVLGTTEVGILDHKLYHTCRIGYVVKLLSIDEDQQGLGLGTRALALARRHPATGG